MRSAVACTCGAKSPGRSFLANALVTNGKLASDWCQRNGTGAHGETKSWHLL